MSNKALLLKNSLLEFYKNKNNLNLFANVINKKTNYSLRIIEWFCNNYSKKHDINYTLPTKNKVFNVYLSYKTQLDSFQKKQFDPFKRKHKGFEKFDLKFENTIITTTVGQLNFFKWCITNNVFDYIEKHLKEIKIDMNNSINYAKKNKEIKLERKKRQPLSVSATRLCIKRYNKVFLDFS